MARPHFKGYIRKNDTVGVRNHVAVIASTACSRHVAEQIARASRLAVAITHEHGCSQVGDDAAQTQRTLAGTGRNPNVAAALVVGLGCETISAPALAQDIADTGKPVRCLVIQEEGGTKKAIAKGKKLLAEMVKRAQSLKRRKVGLDRLILATECGGSDAFSGLTANPAVGLVSDRLVGAGGTVILSETTEFVGAEHVLAKRGRTKGIGRKLVRMTEQVVREALALGVDLVGANPTPGNLVGGITTLEEKSLGCIFKGGTTRIEEVLGYAYSPTRRGLVVMDTPGNDVSSVTGMVAGGAQAVVFTTGRGTPTGHPIAPVIKVATNTGMFRRMRDNMDVNAGTAIGGRETIRDVGDKLFDLLLRVASGRLTKAERLGHREFAIQRLVRFF